MQSFEFTFSESFLIEAYNRYRRCRGLARKGLMPRPLMYTLLSGLLVACLFLEAYFAACGIVFSLVFLLISPLLDQWIMIRRFRKSPFRNDQVRIELSPEGLVSHSTLGGSQLTWTAFTAARRFDDGFLLLQGPGIFNWLPTDRLVTGTVNEVDELLRAQIPDYKPA